MFTGYILSRWKNLSYNLYIKFSLIYIYKKDKI